MIDQKTLIAPSDEEIVERITLGEKHLFEALMRKFNQRLYRLGMAIINDDDEVEDVMQTAYVNAYLHLADFQKKSSFGTWLTRIFINECLLFVKNQKKKRKALEENAEKDFHNETPLNGLMNTELKNILEKSIASLPEKYRLVFVMREVDEMSTNETMEVLNLSESNVKVRLNRAKEMLRDDLGNYYKQVYGFHLTRCDRIVNAVMNKIAVA